MNAPFTPPSLTPHSLAPTDTALRAEAQRWLLDGCAAVLVQVDEVKGSTPRGVGTRMLVSAHQVLGTIGGGHLEWQAIAQARDWLNHAQEPAQRVRHTYPLGPTLGQCCGGVVVLGYERLTAHTLARWPATAVRFHLELHGAGHVGQAIVRLLKDIDCSVRWIDERGDEDAVDGLPDAHTLAALPPHIVWTPTEDAACEVAHAPPSACHLVLTHRHDLDLRIIDAVLRRPDVRFAGLIGSQTKRARFMHRLEAAGLSEQALARLTCPIGLPDLQGKEPAVIAVSVVAQLLQRCPPVPHLLPLHDD